MPQEPVLLDGPALAHALGVSPDLVRKWAQRGKLTRKGTDGRGRALYDYAEALKVHAEMRRRRPLEQAEQANGTTLATPP